MCDIPKQYFDTLLTILGGLIAGFVGVFVGNRQRSREGRLQFRIFISIQKGALQEVNSPDVFYSNTIDQMRDAVFRVLPFLNGTETSDLLLCWNTYNQIDEAYLGQDGYVATYRDKLRDERKWPEEKPKDWLKASLEQMDRIVE